MQIVADVDRGSPRLIVCIVLPPHRTTTVQVHSVFNQPSILGDLLPHLQNQARKEAKNKSGTYCTVQLDGGSTTMLFVSRVRGELQYSSSCPLAGVLRPRCV